MYTTLTAYSQFAFTNDFLLKRCDTLALKNIEKQKSNLKLNKGEILFHVGGIPNGIYILKKGKVKKYTTGISGKQHIFYLAKEQEILGHHSILMNENYSYAISCLTDSEFYLIPKKVFLKTLSADNGLLMDLLKCLSHEFTSHINDTKILAQHSVRERTALSIIRLKKFYNDQNCISLSRRDHSNIIGTSVESLVRALHSFKEEGAIEINDCLILVKDLSKLVRISNFI